jgi:myo-inositol-1(or 4)-monophosphatase
MSARPTARPRTSSRRSSCGRVRPTVSWARKVSRKKAPTVQHRWIVDPLDGTTNFLHGMPHFAVSIALERNGEIVAGVIYNPARTSSTRPSAAAARFSMTAAARCGPQGDVRRGDRHRRSASRAWSSRPFLVELRHVMGECAASAGWVLRRWISPMSLPAGLTASGKTPLEPWDMAAGIILIREAGGFVSDTAGGTDMFGTRSISPRAMNTFSKASSRHWSRGRSKRPDANVTAPVLKASLSFPP